MITIEKETLKNLILKSEPGFLEQLDLQMNGYGTINKFANEDVWVWNKERFKDINEEELTYLTLKIVEG
jgi:hypothetical protein